MDFDLTEEQRALIDLVDQILADHCGHERLTGLEKEARGSGIGSVHDASVWRALADAGAVSALLPESADGGDLGVLGLVLLAEAAGKRTAYLPVVAAVALGALPLARFGGHADLLAAVAAGEQLVTAALEEPGEPTTLTTTARSSGDGYVIDGAKSMVPYGDLADSVLIPAELDGEPAVFVVPRSSMEVTPLLVTGRQPYADLELEAVSVPGTALLARGAEAVDWIRDLGTLALAAEASGICTEAVAITARYTSTRKQFGEPIASLQAVSQRAADAYISAEVLRLTMLHAAWLMDDAARGGETAPSAEISADIAIAKFHAGDAGSRVLHAAQHLHGGIGVDTDYPLHRYFVRGKQVEQTLGTATRQLLRIGAHLAE
ncbi:acyl-CoA dehydrogenase [Catenulispora sp. NF23]|uniref:acyl-CoA dehydrogenase family protein n=1 Tax=Catenulispora pinistramenti TaxID=2705254 RepID=UPI001BAE0B68|nr:acyl-CoA dehydrogenase [Catenulispora pinistramenti]MBS2531884.1 acyl-CoA dehydrogenase [Catenulispora pinistramenti]